MTRDSGALLLFFINQIFKVEMHEIKTFINFLELNKIADTLKESRRNNVTFDQIRIQIQR